ncbi:MAG: exopolyphosphatase [Nitrospirae bacterium]|nr:exopolyphosphatase [Nitrospirota bacterium]
MSILAAIDVGSNTIRLLIGEVKENNIKDIIYERRITRLAEGIGISGKLRSENMENSLLVMREFYSIIKEKGVVTTRAIATSALRDAKNADIFKEKVLSDTGIQIEVISGKKEAELTLKGILFSFSNLSILSMVSHLSLIFDIGGGSTEWIVCKDMHPLGMGSIPVGVIKLCERFIKSDPVLQHEISEMEKEILSHLKKVEEKIRDYMVSDTTFIGTAGTFTTIASIDLRLEKYDKKKVHLHRIPLSRLYDMKRILFFLTLEERKKVVGLEAGREDLIIPGLQFTINIMDFFGFNELIVSEYGLLEGVLLEISQEGIGK